MAFRPEIVWSPVTSKFWRNEDSSGNFVLELPVLKIVRHPRVVLAAEPGSVVQALAPTYRRLVLVNAIFRCTPSVIRTGGVDAVREPVLMICRVPHRESGQAGPGTITDGTGVPAT